MQNVKIDVRIIKIESERETSAENSPKKHGNSQEKKNMGNVNQTLSLLNISLVMIN